ncbi:glycosyltransferase family 4 protein [Caldibacillus thermoamylovorans]|uniref:Glycosyl transferase family 1 domain-containing protein n=1 Tax=Caldibacillus thermoamylovorans TaxID=35841 RepID=A0ABD4A289_9BACI|nr:glycosyltransferase family 4 protein [Caldibacillus thermoamylovorans]KIO70370.1 hypothetical protein B4166_1620 [Caldibacillus thermoamylovorans]KIO70542.1 hypothetical protein B4167_3856 [Caldibacillus thermoamylovorans]
MNILHLNTNYEVSSIYPNMLYEINKLNNVSGRLYYPVSSKKIIKDKNASYVDVSNCLNKSDRLFYFRRNKKLYENITKIYNMKQYDMTLAYSLFSNGYLAFTLKKKFDIPYIVIVQNTDINMYFKRMVHLRNIGRKIIQEAHKVIFISEPYKQMLLNGFIMSDSREQVEKKSVVIPFGIDNFWFENKNDKRRSRAQDKVRLLYVGKINKNKNIVSSAKACDFLIKHGNEVSLTIVGDIQDKRVAKELERYKFINYIPFIQPKELLRVYRKNDIFIMPSIKESFGLVYAEAMSQGLPIIYTRGQGFDKHFTEGNVGHSVYPTNIAEIANRIISIRDNYELYSENCLKLVEKFKWTNITKNYEVLFEELSGSLS